MHSVPAEDLPRTIAVAVVQHVAVAVLRDLAEDNPDRGAVADGFGVDGLSDGGRPLGRYLTALMVRVRVPDGTDTVTLSPFLCPTRARPTGESTEMGPADGSLSTAPTRW